MEENRIKRVGVIGLGAMGHQMARHMARAGFEVSGHDVDAAARAKAEGIGIRIRGSAAELARDADMVVVMVQTDAQVEEVATTLLPVLAAGSVICIASSVSPDLCRQLAHDADARGVGVLDTPVVLGQEAANNGTLTIYVGGDERWVTRARPALQAFAKDVLHLGGPGSGQIAKTINNLLLWACMTANFEALSFAKQLGADIPRLVDALRHGSGANWSLSRWGKSTGKWSEKDMDVALDMAQTAKAALPLFGLVDQLVKGLNQEKMKQLLS